MVWKLTRGEPEQGVREGEKSTDDLLYTAKRERRFLWKLDICLITWAWCAYLIKLIDSSNYKTAYASGMKEDLDFVGNQLNYLDTLYRVGYALFLIPSQLILTRIKPNIWLPSLEIAWGVMTGLMAVAKTPEGMYALRFFIGVFEASSYPGIITILCNWYTPRELATRIAIFGTSYPASQMFVSFMQVAIQSTLDGKAGVPGWKWLFIFNAIMTVIVAAAGYIMIPSVPGESKVFWMTEEDNMISRSRMDRVKKLPPTRLNKAILKQTFSSWLLYVFAFAYSFWSWSQNANTWIILYLKALKNADGTKRFSVQEINAIPIGGYALQLIAMLLFAWLSSRTGWRATWIVVQMCLFLVGSIILSVWPAGFGIKMVGFFFLWVSNSAGPILLAWMADCCPSPEERSMIVAIAVTFVFVIDAWANVFIYPASQAPHYKIGYKAATAFAVACILLTGVFKLLEKREKQRRGMLDTFLPDTSSLPEELPSNRMSEVDGDVEEKGVHKS